ncbi:MAG: CinA family protein [Nitrospirota bacterium]
MDIIEEIIGRILRERNMTISLAESCTGGLIGSRITDVPGSSEYLYAGVVCYSNRAKIDILGVPEKIIKEYGAVSSETASYMAEGVRKIAHTDIGLAVTGIAGPGGGSREKPVGSVYIAISIGEKRESEYHKFDGDRKTIKLQSSEMALNILRRYLG